MVFAGRSMDVRVGSVRLLGATEAAPSLAGLPRRLTGPQVHRVAGHLEQAFPAYDAPTMAAEASASAVDIAVGEEMALFDAQVVVRAHEQAVYARPIESWMTFLHPTSWLGSACPHVRGWAHVAPEHRRLPRHPYRFRPS